MTEYQLGAVETRFASIIWDNAPLTSAELTRMAQERLGWKKSTTYPVLKKLCEQGLFRNEGGEVSAVVSREDFYAMQSEKFVEENFDGSLPAFLAAFTARKHLSEQEIYEIRRMIESIGGK